MKQGLLILMATIVFNVPAFAAQPNKEAKSLYCRLSHDLKNQDFQIAYPALEPGPWNMGGLIGRTSKEVRAGSTNLEISVTLIDTDGLTFGNPKNLKEKSIGLEMKLLTDDIMPYSISVQSNSLLNNFLDKISSSLNLDTTPLGFDGKYYLFCQSTPIE